MELKQQKKTLIANSVEQSKLNQIKPKIESIRSVTMDDLVVTYHMTKGIVIQDKSGVEW